MALTKEQELAVTTSGTNIIVSAGAGSGKTAVLTTRVIEKLKQGIHINELLILTFTNAAAAEMKDRIQTKIIENNLTQELDLLAASYITTFDSFSLSIVKKYHYLLNLEKNINITESSIINLEKKKILTNIMEKFYQKKDSKFCNLITTLCEKDDENLKLEILSLANHLEIKTDKEDYLKNYIKNNYNENIKLELLKKYQTILEEKIHEIFLDIQTNKHDLTSEYVSKIMDCLSELNETKELDNLIAKIKVIKLPVLPKGSEEETKKAKEKLNKKIIKLKEYASYGYTEEILNDYEKTKEEIEVIIEILKEYFYELENYKKKENVFDFNDIAHLALNLIRENSNIRENLKKQFKEIMVDEYQDTSDIQEEFINLIANNNVYMVGDIKQSIYRFRNANPKIFEEKYNAYSKKENGIKIDLLKNFRSRSEVLDNINIIFTKIMDEKIGQANYQETHQMVFGNMNYETNGKTNYNYQMEIRKYQEEQGYSKEEIEIFAIAKDIKEKLDSNYQVLDKETSTLRKATYQDFCIIMDRNATFNLTKKIFEYLGIPLNLYKDEELNSGIEIQLIKNIIKFLIHINEKNYNQEYQFCFASIARSFLYRLSDNEIFEYLTQHSEKNSPIYKELLPITKYLRTSSIKEIIEKIIENTRFYEKLITFGNIDETILKVEKIMDLADNLQELNYNIYDFIKYLDDLLSSNETIKYNKNETSSNSVKIMNIHKSKGLEFPICYFCGLYKSFSKEDIKGDLIYIPESPISISIFKEGIYETFIKLLIKDTIVKEDISEKIRLFYVALTRAREKMIFFLPQKENLQEFKNEDGLVLNTIRNNYQSFADILNSIPKTLEYYTSIININDLNLTKDYMLNKKLEIKNQSSNNNFIEPLNICIKKLEKQTFSKKLEEPITKEIKRNIDLGNAVHETLEYIDFKNFDSTSIENNFIRELVINLLNNPLMKNINNAEIFQEYEFFYEEDEIEYHGKIDLMLVYNDHIDIIDYKLDNILSESYKKQINGYKKYIEKISNKKTNTYLYSIISSKVLKIK